MVNFDNEVDDYKYFCEVKPFKVDVEFVSDSVESVKVDDKTMMRLSLKHVDSNLFRSVSGNISVPAGLDTSLVMPTKYALTSGFLDVRYTSEQRFCSL